MKLKNLFVFLSFAIVVNVNAQWSTNYGNNLQITNWSRLPLSAASDGDGGVYIAINRDITINDTIPGSYSYLFRLDKYGYNKWSEPIHIGIEDWQRDVELIEDGSGGVIACIIDLDFIRWSGGRWIWDYKISLQRIDSLGNKLWGDGIFVSTDTTDQYEFDICTDGNGGCYVSWLSEKTMDRIYSDGYRTIQHISASGERMWSDTGKVLYEGGVANYWNKRQQIVSDNNGGLLIINTQDLNVFSFARLDINGNFMWEVSSRMDDFYKGIYSDPKGGLIAFASKWDSANEFLIFEMDRINEYGEYVWDDKKVFADSVGDRSEITDLYFNDDSSASIYWTDYTYTTVPEYASYYQVINIDGSLYFENKGIEPFDENSFGSALFNSYNDYLFISGNFVQKMSKIGEKKWGEGGKQFTTRLADYDHFTSDTREGFIKTWIEGLNGLWAQQVSSNGNLGEVITSIGFSDNSLPNNYKLPQNYPNPFNPSTIISYSLPQSGFVQLKVYNILGSVVATLVDKEQPLGNYKIEFNASNLTSGIYFYRLQSGSFTKTKKLILLR